MRAREPLREMLSRVFDHYGARGVVLFPERARGEALPGQQAARAIHAYDDVPGQLRLLASTALGVAMEPKTYESIFAEIDRSVWNASHYQGILRACSVCRSEDEARIFFEGLAAQYQQPPHEVAGTTRQGFASALLRWSRAVTDPSRRRPTWWEQIARDYKQGVLCPDPTP